uniref:Uncharacterized protein n=1 Tax=Anopheles atroparvus TaxID=41427 RepID=A0A182JK05_ANOAO
MSTRGEAPRMRREFAGFEKGSTEDYLPQQNYALASVQAKKIQKTDRRRTEEQELGASEKGGGNDNDRIDAYRAIGATPSFINQFRLSCGSCASASQYQHRPRGASKSVSHREWVKVRTYVPATSLRDRTFDSISPEAAQVIDQITRDRLIAAESSAGN